MYVNCTEDDLEEESGGKGKGKDKVHPTTDHEGPVGEQMYSSTPLSTSALDGGGWSTPRPGRFTPGKDPIPIVQEAGWAPGPLWTSAENLAPIGIRSPDRPTRSESLYRLSYLGPEESDGRVFNFNSRTSTCKENLCCHM